MAAKTFLRGRRGRLFESRFRTTNIILFVLMTVLMVTVASMTLYSTTRTVSRDYASLYSSRIIGTLNTHLNREIGLMSKAAHSKAIVEWFADETDPVKRLRAYEEMMSFIEVLYSANLYFGIHDTLHEYSIEATTPFAEFTPYDTLKKGMVKDSWYFEAHESRNAYQFNVDIDKLKRRKLVWLNYTVRDQDLTLGVLCTGLQFNQVLENLFGEYDKANVRGLVIDENGVIQMDSAVPGDGDKLIYGNSRRIQEEYPDPVFIKAMDAHLTSLDGYFGPVIQPEVIELSFANKFVSIAPIESTNWTVITVYNADSLFSIAKLWPLFGIMFVMFILYTLALGVLSRRLILDPFSRLMDSVSHVHAGGSGEVYGTTRQDEFGELARTIEDMRDRLDTYSAELLASMKNAEKASLAKSYFLANMSHEMRTPMNAVIGMTRIARGTDDLSKIRYCLEKIETASVHLVGVINDILDMSKIESGKFELHDTVFHFEKMIARTTSVIGFRMEEKKQIFSLELDKAIPEYVFADEQHLAQVIANLLSNAVKFTPEGGLIRLAARVKEQNKETCVLEISVADSGIGISKDHQARLFQSFEQADSSISRRFGGTGLGLAISKSIITLMGGDIGVESEPGLGARFTFTVRVGQARASGEPVSRNFTDSSLEYGEGSSVSLAGKRILLAEDVDLNREILLSLLDDTGIEFEAVENGAEAVQAFRKHPERFDLILMDIHMPVMDGYEATKTIRALKTPNAAHIPIIAMTANVFKEDIDRCLRAGMDDHVGKPIDLEDLLRKLRKFLS